MYTDGQALLYSEFPSRFVWNKAMRKWTPRKKALDRNVGRIYHCNPTAGEKFYLRMLLTIVRSPTSFTDLRTYNGICYETYHEACIARGLVENDQEWIECFTEAVIFTTGHGLRTLFLTGLRMETMARPLLIWNQFKDHICDDLLRELERRSVPISSLQNAHIDYGLYLLSVGLTDVGKQLTDFGLPLPQYGWSVRLPYVGQGFDPVHETAVAEHLVSKLNPDQLSCFRTICSAIETGPQTAHFYLQGPGGTGKTFLYKALCHLYRAQGKSVLCVASTGIAALLLPNGCTSHTQFKIPIDLTDTKASVICL